MLFYCGKDNSHEKFLYDFMQCIENIYKEVHYFEQIEFVKLHKVTYF